MNGVQILLTLALLVFAESGATGADTPNNEATEAQPDPQAADPRPPIPVRFRLAEAGFVTLVIERDAQSPPAPQPAVQTDAKRKLHYVGPLGLRVKNLISNTWFPAGEHTVWWDGLDESNAHLFSVPNEALYYRIDGSPVPAGDYRVRGLTRQAVTPKYEFAVYSGGQSPPWQTKSGRGGWLADHTPPAGALFLPGSGGGMPRVLLSSWVAEAGDGLVWCDLEGRRVAGTRGIGAGGGWGGAELLARDVGTKTVPKHDAYLAGNWFDRAEVWALGANKKLYAYPFARKEDWAVGGLAARDGLIALGLPKVDRVLLIDAAAGTLRGEVEIRSPRGVAFDAAGRLLILSGTALAAWDVVSEGGGDGASARLSLKRTGWQSAATFEDPQGLALDDRGNIYVSDWGNSHQVKVLGPDGKLLRTIGRPGAPRVGPYDPLHMNQPKGLTVAADGQLWVAENWLAPKRVSVWSPDGRLVKAMYGPNRYGGGGSLDPRDRTRFFSSYADGHNPKLGGAMEFKLDWERGTAELKHIYHLPGQAGTMPPSGSWRSFPETPVWVGDRLYLSNCFTGGPTDGEDVVSLWHYRDGVAVPVASLGDVATWDLLRTEPFRSRWPTGVAVAAPGTKSGNATFAWCDLNDDAQAQPDEVQVAAGSAGSLTLDGELGLTTSTAVRYTPVGFTPMGAPRYDLARGTKLAEGGRTSHVGGGGQVLAMRDGGTVFTFPPEPLPGCYLAGSKDGRLTWTYPVEFLGLHASHFSKPPRHPGEVIGATRLLGRSFLAPGPGKEGGGAEGGPVELWAINGNYGNVFLFTTDGLLVATLFQDARVTKPWPEEERRGADLGPVSLQDECFFPSIQQMADGRVYLVAGKSFSAIFEITGLDTIRRLPQQRLIVTADHVAAARHYADVRDTERAREDARLPSSSHEQPGQKQPRTPQQAIGADGPG